MGMRSEVRLAAWMPAMRATSSGLPLGFAGRAASTAAESSTKADAVAVRRVGCLAPTSTMGAWPDASKCESVRAWLSRLGMGLLREAGYGRRAGAKMFGSSGTTRKQFERAMAARSPEPCQGTSATSGLGAGEGAGGGQETGEAGSF